MNILYVWIDTYMYIYMIYLWACKPTNIGIFLDFVAMLPVLQKMAMSSGSSSSLG